jgi:cellulose synthase (UDP-forming)
MPEETQIDLGSSIGIGLQHTDGLFVFPAIVVVQNGKQIGLRLQPLTLAQERKLVQCTFGRADAWTDWNRTTDPDRPLRSLAEVLFYGLKGYVHIFRLAPRLFARRARPLTSS